MNTIPFSKRLSAAVMACLLPAVCAAGQQPASGQNSILSKRYAAAENFQANGQLDRATEQYRIFIADVMGQLAIGHARSGDREQAASEFDEALSLVPDFPALRLEYARVALEMGNAERAQNLARSVLQTHPADKKFDAEADTLIGSALKQAGKLREARSYFEQAVAQDASFQNGYRLAVVDLDLGDGDAATHVLSEMKNAIGDTAEIHMLFGQAYARSDFQNRALAEFKEAAEKNPKLPGVHYAIAWMLIAVNGSASVPEAEAQLRAEIVNFPEDASSYAALGHLLADQNKGEEAVANLKRAMALDPQNPNGYFYLGKYDLEQHNLPEAISSLRKAVALTPNVSANGTQVQKAHYLLGRALLQSGQTEEGKREMAASQAAGQQSLSRDQDQLRVYLDDPKSMDRTSSDKQFAQPSSATVKDPAAAKQVEEFEKRFAPALADSYNNLGAIAGSQSNFPLALNYFERAEEWNPSMPGLDLNWGRAAFSAGKTAEAIKPLTRYLAAHPEDGNIRGILGVALVDEKRYAEAKQVFATLANKAGSAPEVRLAEAQALGGTGDIASAEAILLKLQSEDSSNARVHAALGDIYATRQRQRAVQEYEQAIQLDPKNASAYASVGHLQLVGGDPKTAETNLAQALRLDPSNAQVRSDLDACLRQLGRH